MSKSDHICPVGLSVTGYADTPILIDSTRPVAGHVHDGLVLGKDIDFQVNSSQVCAHWENFADPESSIDR